MLGPNLYKLSLIFYENKHVFLTFSINASIHCFFHILYVSYKLSHDENEKCFYCGHCCISLARKALFDDHFNLEMSKTEIKKVLIKTLVLKDILIFLRSPKMQWPFFSFLGLGGGPRKKYLQIC